MISHPTQALHLLIVQQSSPSGNVACHPIKKQNQIDFSFNKIYSQIKVLYIKENVKQT